MSLVILNRSRIPSSPSPICAPSGGQSGEGGSLCQHSRPQEDLTELQNVGTEMLVMDVCGFLASPYPFTPFPVTASNVCGVPPFPTFSPCGFYGIDSTSPPPPFQGQCVTQAWHVIQSISFSCGQCLVQGQAHNSREANQSQSISLRGFVWAPGCAHRSRLEPWRHVGWSWGYHLANLQSLKRKPTHRAEESEMQNDWALVGSSEHRASCF